MSKGPRWITEAEVASLGEELQVANVTLTNEQILTLPTTGVEVIPAPGEGKIIVPFGGVVVLDARAGIYTCDAGSSWQLLSLVEGGAIEATGLISITGSPGGGFTTFGSATDRIAFSIPAFWGIGSSDFTGYLVSTGNTGKPIADNLPLVIQDRYDGVSNYGGGDPANKLTVVVYYLVVTL